MKWRAGLELEHVDLAQGGVLDQSTGTPSYIRCEGSNPAVPGIAPDLRHNRYSIVKSEGAVAFRWYARATSWEYLPTENYHGFKRITVGGEPAFDLGTGATAEFIIATPNVYTIVCEEQGADGKVVGTARYVQVVQTSEQAVRVGAFRKFLQQADAAMAEIQEGKEVGIRAVYVNQETGQQVTMALFIGPDAADPKRVKLVDLLPGVERLSYGGTNAEAALGDFEGGNSYPKGTIRLEIPANASGIPTIVRTIRTKGESDFATWASRTGWASLGLTVAGLVAAAVPGGQPVALVLFIGRGAAGAVSGGLSLQDRLQKAEVSSVGVAIDVLGIASSILGGAGAFRALRQGAALSLASRGGRFLLYGGFTTGRSRAS